MLQVKAVRSGSQQEKDFLALPGTLYAWDTITQDQEEEKAQIAGIHPLSSYYQFQAYVGYDHGQCLIRGAITYYPETQKCYLGYFESVNDKKVMEAFIGYLRNELENLGVEEIIGPVDASFWLGYRMKMSNFQQGLFTGEPHNLSYYPQLWQEVGFEVIENYYSNYYAQADASTDISKAKNRYEKFQQEGIEIIQPKASDWDQNLQAVYILIMKRFANFPLYHSISFDAFQALFNPLKKGLNFAYLSLAYDSGRLVGVNIGYPNYGNISHRPQFFKYIGTFFKRKYFPKEFILMYLAAEADYPGLGLAMLYPILVKFKKHGTATVSALIHQGKATGAYFPTYKQNSTHYALFKLKL